MKKALALIVLLVVGFVLVSSSVSEGRTGEVTMDFKDTNPGYDFPEDNPVV